MRLVSYVHQGTAGFGVIDGQEILSLKTDATPDLTSWLEHRPRDPQSEANRPRLPLRDVKFLPPVPEPRLLLCVATNYHVPGREPAAKPDYPMLFTRTGSAQAGHGQNILRPTVSDSFDYEGELAIVIGRAGRHIPQSEAMEHVAGYACFNDGSVRDWQKHSSQFTPGKNFYQSGGFGPWLVTADAVPDPYALTLETRVNGATRQSARLADMIFRIDWLISYCSTFARLSVGDVIATGTPTGFGSSRTPPEFLKPGDEVEVDIPGVGLLRNTVAEDPRGIIIFS